METTITIKDIIAFVRKALNLNLLVEYFQASDDYCSEIIVSKNDNDIIRFYFQPGIIRITTGTGDLSIDYSLTERDLLQLRTLSLDIKEIRANKALYVFNNFLKEEEPKPTIDDLDNDDE